MQKRCVISICGQAQDPDYPVDIWFDSLKSEANVLSKENQQLLKVIAKQKAQLRNSNQVPDRQRLSDAFLDELHSWQLP